MKIRYLSFSQDSKTAVAYKLCILAALFFLILIILSKVIAIMLPESTEGLIGYLVSMGSSSFIDIGLAFVILLFGIGIILYFFYKQFQKLADMMDEIENEHN